MQKQHINDSLYGLAYTLASVVDIIFYNSLIQLALIEDFHQMSDAHSLNNRILRGFHSLVKTKYQFPDKSRATHSVMYSKHATCTTITR